MHKLFHYFSRSTVRLIEITLGVAIVLMVGTGFIFWQMSRQPFDLMFAEKYIENALSTDQYRVDFKDVDLKWPHMKGPLRLGIQGVTVTTATGAKAISVDQVDIGVSSAFLIAGMIRPVSLYLANPTFRLVREQDGSISFLMQEDRLSHDERPFNEQFKVAMDALSGETGLLRRFRFLAIENAQLKLQDAESGDEVVLSALDAHFRRNREKITANAEMVLNDRLNDGAGGITIGMTYDRASGGVQAKTAFKNLGPAILNKLFTHNEAIQRQSGAVDGQFSFSMDAEQNVQHFSGRFDARNVEIYWPQEYDAPQTMSAMSVVLGFDPSQRRIESEHFSATINDVPLGGSLAVQLRDNQYDLLINATVPEVTQEKVETFFPKSEMDGELAEWLVHKMDGGIFRNVTAKVPLTLIKQDDADGNPAWDVLFSEANMHIAFEAEGVNLRYQDTLKPALDIKGHGFFDGEKLEVIGESGRIEDVQAHDVTVVVDDVAVKGGGYAHITVNAKGPLSTLLRYIADEPIGMGEDMPFKADEVKGIADIQVTVGLPTLEDVPKEEVKVKVTGTLSELMLPDVVQKLALSDGPLQLETLEGGFTLKGDAKLEGQPLTLDMTQYFSSEGREFLTKVDAKITSDGALRNKFGIDLSDYISGDVPLDIAYLDNGKGKETVAAKGDLGPAIVHIKPFSFEKKSGVPGTLSLNAVMDKGVLSRVTNLTIESKNLSASEGTLTFRPLKGRGVELSGGTIPRAKIGKTTGSVDFTITTEDVLKINAAAPVFDAQPFLQSSGRRKQKEQDGGQTQPMIISLKADKVLALNNQQIAPLTLYAQMDKDADITRLEVSGRTPSSDISVQFRPDPQTGKRFFRLETQDGGAVLAAAGLYEDVQGGSLMVFGEPKAGGSSTGNLYGTAQLENFRVVRAPGLAKILSLMSLGGLRDILGQQGIVFSKLEADFEWRFQKEGNLLLVDNGRTSGSSVGLTFEGVVDRGANTTDIKGTIIPMTEINNVLKNIPLIGDLLTGGTGLIAATYTMKGPSNDPSVMVNPLSVLAPGFLRTLLFEGGFSKKPVSETIDAKKKQAAVKPPASESRTAGN